MSPETNLLEVDEVFRDAGLASLFDRQARTIDRDLGSALDRLGMSPQENRYALAGTTT